MYVFLAVGVAALAIDDLIQRAKIGVLGQRALDAEKYLAEARQAQRVADHNRNAAQAEAQREIERLRRQVQDMSRR